MKFLREKIYFSLSAISLSYFEATTLIQTLYETADKLLLIFITPKIMAARIDKTTKMYIFGFEIFYSNFINTRGK